MAIATMISPSQTNDVAQTPTRPHAPVRPQSGDFVQDVTEMAERIDRRLRMSLTPQQYAMVQDLVLATRITTIARDTDDACMESASA